MGFFVVTVSISAVSEIQTLSKSTLKMRRNERTRFSIGLNCFMGTLCIKAISVYFSVCNSYSNIFVKSCNKIKSLDGVLTDLNLL